MTRRKYCAVLFAPDGDYVTDYHGSESIEEVEELLADQGSRWFFYPYCVVVVDHGATVRGGWAGIGTRRWRIVNRPPFGFLLGDGWQGRQVGTLARALASMTPAEHEAVLG